MSGCQTTDGLASSKVYSERRVETKKHIASLFMYFGKYYFVLLLEVDNITVIPPLTALEARDITEIGSTEIACSSNTRVNVKM